jgi:uncharacterized OB-fold protein
LASTTNSGATGFKDDIPYNVALVELAEGPQIITQIIGCRNEELRCGASVEVAFDEVTPDVTLPKSAVRQCF